MPLRERVERCRQRDVHQMTNEDIEEAVALGGFVLGEYTVNVGPFAEDRFFVLISASFGAQEWVEDDPVVDRLLESVSAHAGEEISPMLAKSTDLASRVLFPFSLRARDLYRFVPEKRGWLKDFWVSRVRLELAPEVCAYLEQERTRSGKP